MKNGVRPNATNFAPKPHQFEKTDDLSGQTAPTFSPDGDQVAFTWNGEEQDNFDIYVKLIGTGGPPLRLTTDPADDGQPRLVAGRPMDSIHTSRAGLALQNAGKWKLFGLLSQLLGMR